MPARKPTFVSLFSGCGGLDLGFLNAGFKGLAAIDIDPLVLEVHKKNLKCPTQVLDLSLSQSLDGISFTCDALIAGSPCQGFSTIGKRRLHDPRNKLLLVTGQVAKKLLPRLVVAENVPAVASGKHGSYWRKLHQLLREAGYKTTDLKCDSFNFGVPQRRKRLFLIAWQSHQEIDFSAMPLREGGSLSSVLVNTNACMNHEPIVLAEGTPERAIAQVIQQGQKLSNVRSGFRSVHTWDIPSVFGKTNIEERRILEEIIRLRRRNRIRDHGDADPVKTRVLYTTFGKYRIQALVSKGYLRKIDDCHDLVGTFNGKYRRLLLNQPAPTVDTRFGQPTHFLHPTEHRGFSAREAARIQGFPDDFIFQGSHAEQFRMIGNAVPPPMAQHLATFLRKSLSL